MARNVQGDQPLAPANVLLSAWRSCLPSLDRLSAGVGRYALRDYSVIYLGPGSWRAKIKALDREAALPVILFADGDSHAACLLAAERAVKAERWRTDQYPGKGWAR
jgi:hypothetical protein